MKLKFTLTGQSMRCYSPGVMVAGTMQIFEAEFDFRSTDWLGMEKWAHFKQNDVIYDFKLDENDRIMPEAGLNLGAGKWEIYVHGNNVGEVEQRIVSESCFINVQQAGFVEGPMPGIPVTAAEQIAADAEGARRTAEKLRQDAEQGLFDGATFTPFVDSEGNLSWSNDKGLDNPPAVNLKGKGFGYEGLSPEQVDDLAKALEQAALHGDHSALALDLSVDRSETAKAELNASIESSRTAKTALEQEKAQAVQIVEDLRNENSKILNDYKGLHDDVSTLKGDITRSKEAIKDLSDKKITKFYASNLGETTLNDSDNGKITDMFIFGKSYQHQGEIELEDGTTVTVPNPDYPQEIEAVANPVVKVCGKNLLKPTLETKTLNGVTCTNNGDGTYTMNGTLTNAFQFISQLSCSLEAGTYKVVGCPSGGSNKTFFLRMREYNGSAIGALDIGDGFILSLTKKTDLSFGLCCNEVGYTFNNLVFKPMLTTDLNATYDDFEPYKGQEATLPYTLNAIPVSSGGNVTIDGQQYIADYVDVEKKQIHRFVDPSKLDPTVSIVDNTDLLLSSEEVTDLTDEEVQAFKDMVTYYPTTNVMVTSDQLDGYSTFNYQISMANGWNYVKQQLGDTREYIYDMDLQSAEAYVNSEYAVALAELEV